MAKRKNNGSKQNDVTPSEQRKAAGQQLRPSQDTLERLNRELQLRNRIAEIFLTVSDDNMYGEVLEVVLRTMQSRYGVFGYIGEDGSLVCPSMTREVREKCQVPDKDLVFPREKWGGIWGRALTEKRTLYSNGPVHVPKRHIPMERAIAAPIMYRREVIGLFLAGNKRTDYVQEDVRLLQTIAGHVGPILKARLQRDRQQAERKRAEEALRAANQQLRASEQQLKAANQQLRASDQQLRAANQQLTAANQQIRESEEKYRNLYESSKDGIASSDMQGNVTGANQAFLNMLGYTLREITELTYRELTPKKWHKMEEDVIRDQVLPRGYSDEYEKELVKKDGTIFPVSMRVWLIERERAKPTRMWVIVRDITERRQAENKLFDYHLRLKSLASRLTATEERQRRRIATALHDQIGQELAMTKFALQSLTKSPAGSGLPAKLQEICRDIDEIIERTHSLTYELSDSVLYEVGLEAAVESWLQKEVEVRHGIKTTFASSADPRNIHLDLRAALFRDIRELLTNIVKHAGADAVDVSMRRTRKKLHIAVKDNGVGFSPEKLESLPDEKGGFGLFSVREHIADLGGQFEIDSKPGKGTCITIKVPV